MSFQADISKIKEIIGNNNFLNDTEGTNFLNILEEAQLTLSDGFEGLEDDSSPNKKFYEYAFNLIDTEFDTLIKSIENIRSSYLPAEVFSATLSMVQNRDQVNSVIEEVSKESTPLEGYHNAFFRMIGLPSWEDVESNFPGIKLDIIDTNGKIVSGAINFENIYSAFLDKRQAFSTIGCAAAVSHFDLIQANQSSADFLKKRYSFSSDAISQIESFSLILSKVVDANEEEIKTLEKSYKDYVSKLLSNVPTGKSENLLAKVQAIYDENKISDPISWSKKDLNKFFIVDNEPETIANYTGYLLFIYYAYIGDDITRFLPSNAIDKVYKDLVKKEPSDESLNNIEKNIYVYSSLLFPLVKDGRISKCINDPEKIVADPFLPVTKRMVNGKFLRSSLLESIIRIRTDVISGTTSYSAEGVPYIIGEDGTKELEQASVSGELMGYLESLLIIRMLDSLEALAKGAKRNIEQISVTQRRTGKGLFGSCYDPKGSVLSAVPTVDRDISRERVVLNNYALIEDSIMLLLGVKDTDQDSLSLQTSVNRNSSVPSSHLMSSLVNLVQVPRKYINQRIDEEDRRAKTQNSVGSKVAKDLEVTFGIRSGVGIVDFIAIVIALLTMEETDLVALLTNSQRDLMYSQINKDTFDEEKRRKISEIPIGQAINKLTERVHTIYQLFVGFLQN